MDDLERQRDWRPEGFAPAEAPAGFEAAPGFEAPDFPEEVAGDGGPYAAGPCRLCGARPARIMQYMYVMSFVVLTRHKRWEDQLCRSCSTRMALQHEASSLFLGWWAFPWGLMTFEALRVNTLTLWRWSKVPRAAIAALLLAAIAVPVGVVWTAARPNAEEAAARKTGDWLPDETLAVLTKAQEKESEGDLLAARALFEEGVRLAPGSSAAQYSLANVLSELGLWAEAEKPAARAVDIAPEDTYKRWLYGTVLAHLGKEAEARQQLDHLAAEATARWQDAYYHADLALTLEEPTAALQSTEQGLAASPGQAELHYLRFKCLVALDRVEDAIAARAEIPAEVEPGSDVDRLDLVLAVRQDPPAGIERLLERWPGDEVWPEWMPAMMEAAQRAGALEAARQQVIAWLEAPSTPGEAWLKAAPWFPEGSWEPALDRYLARRTEAAPGLMRLMTMGSPEQRAQQLALADKLRHLDHKLAPQIDSIYYSAKLPDYASAAELQAEFTRHLAEYPEHSVCLTLFLGQLPLQDPQQQEQWVAAIEAASPLEDPWLRASWELMRLEGWMNFGRARDAESKLLRLLEENPAADGVAARVALAEAAFHRRDAQALASRVRRLQESSEEASAPPALALRWSEQVASGAPVSWSADVEAWLEQHGDDALATESACGQAILLAQGRSTQADYRERVGFRSPGTVELIAFFKASDGVAPHLQDLSALESLVASPYPAEFAPRLARSILERRGKVTS